VKVLFDTNVPHPLRKHLPGHDIATAQAMGWAELVNGDLLATAEAAGFELIITADQNLRYQQNLAGRTISLLILPTNHFTTLVPLAPKLLVALAAFQPGGYVEIPMP
jgi:hypothetical protein